MLDTSGNATAQAFESAAGEFGMRAFGVVLWAAAITSVIGAAFTSVSFFDAFSPRFARRAAPRVLGDRRVHCRLHGHLFADRHRAVGVAGLRGRVQRAHPADRVFDPAVCGVAPAGAARGYKYPAWLLVLGAVVAALTWYMGVTSARTIFDYLAG